MTTTFSTIVLWSPPTPLGLLPGRWVIDHRCTLCGQRVTTAELIMHAESHAVSADEQLRVDVP